MEIKKLKIIGAIILIIGLICEFTAIYIIPTNIDNTIESQRNTIHQDISDNIEISKESKKIYLNKIVEEIDKNSNTICKTFYWNDFEVGSLEKIYFDKSKNYIASKEYQGKYYEFSYNIDEAHRILCESYFVLDENGENNVGEKFSYNKCLNESIDELTDKAIPVKKDLLMGRMAIWSALLFILPMFLIPFGLALILDIKKQYTTQKSKINSE